MLVPGAVSLGQALSAMSALSTTCPNPYYSSGSQCCYYGYCYTPASTITTADSSAVLTPGIVLLCVGFVSAIVGIVLLCKACKFYRNNNETCCWMICLSLFYQTIYRWLGVIEQHSQYFPMSSLAEKVTIPNRSKMSIISEAWWAPVARLCEVASWFQLLSVENIDVAHIYGRDLGVAAT